MKQRALSGREFYGSTFLAPFGLILADLFGQTHFDNFHLTEHDDLKDTYYDTANLDLIRFGAILRFRSVTDQAFWNVQLFSRKGAKYIIRRDLEYVGHSTEIPAPLTGLLYAFHRSRPLIQIGQIRTAQESYTLCDTEGVVRDEIIDRDITSSGALWEAIRFREITIWSKDRSRARHRGSKSLEARARVQGGRLVSSAPEIIHVLGSAAASPFSILGSPPDSSSRVYSIFQRAVALSTLRLLRFDPGVRLSSDPEMVHEFRVGIRRLRSDLRSFSKVIDSTEAAALRSKLAWLGGEVGKMRDCDVLVGHVGELSLHLVNEDTSGVVILQSFLDDLCKNNRNTLLEILDTERYANLVETITNIADGSVSIENMAGALQHDPPAQSSEDIIRKIVRQRWRKYANAAQQIGSGSSDLELHRVRILAKRCRYAAETALPLFGDPVKKFSGGLAEVQDLLGKYHDCVFQEVWLRKVAEGLPEATVAIGALLRLMHQERQQLRAEWPALFEKTSSPKLRRWLRASGS